MPVRINLNNLKIDIDDALDICLTQGVPINCYGNEVELNGKENIDCHVAKAIAYEDSGLLYIWSSDIEDARQDAMRHNDDKGVKMCAKLIQMA